MIDEITFSRNFEEMKDKWQGLHSCERFRPQYPSEHVVRFIFTQFPREPEKRKALKILDLGCGGGRHTIFLAQEGFETYGSDISEIGLGHLKDNLIEKLFKANLVNAQMQKQPFPDNYFDGVISNGVYYYDTLEGFKESIAELHRILKNGGKALVFIRTTEDYRYGKGKKIGKNSFVLDIDDTNEKGMIMTFLERFELNSIFSKFNEIIIDKTETTFSNSEKLNSDWIIIVEKEK